MLQSDATTNDAVPRLTWNAVELESKILAVLDRAPAAGEQLEFAFRRKEAELIAVFDRLTLRDARELHRRLELVLPNDPIASRFIRLIGSRRARLLAFLQSARRREALRSRPPMNAGGPAIPRAGSVTPVGVPAARCCTHSRQSPAIVTNRSNHCESARVERGGET